MLRLWLRLSRRALPVLVLLATGAGAEAQIETAAFSAPTTRYAHGVLGDAIEYGALVLQTTETSITITLPQSRVFEDLAPRLVDVDRDGDLEALVVESEANTGAQLAIYDEHGKVAATPHIGTRNRWLAPIGVADLDGDGFVEIAYIDRPHLAKTLRVWRFRDGALSPVADLAGLTNHRIGEDFISGGIRQCNDTPEMITASANWRSAMATRLIDGKLETRTVGHDTSFAGLNALLSC